MTLQTPYPVNAMIGTWNSLQPRVRREKELGLTLSPKLTFLAFLIACFAISVDSASPQTVVDAQKQEALRILRLVDSETANSSGDTYNALDLLANSPAAIRVQSIAEILASGELSSRLEKRLDRIVHASTGRDQRTFDEVRTLVIVRCLQADLGIGIVFACTELGKLLGIDRADFHGSLASKHIKNMRTTRDPSSFMASATALADFSSRPSGDLAETACRLIIARMKSLLLARENTDAGKNTLHPRVRVNGESRYPTLEKLGRLLVLIRHGLDVAAKAAIDRRVAALFQDTTDPYRLFALSKGFVPIAPHLGSENASEAAKHIVAAMASIEKKESRTGFALVELGHTLLSLYANLPSEQAVAGAMELAAMREIEGSSHWREQLGEVQRALTRRMSSEHALVAMLDAVQQMAAVPGDPTWPDRSKTDRAFLCEIILAGAGNVGLTELIDASSNVIAVVNSNCNSWHLEHLFFALANKDRELSASEVTSLATQLTALIQARSKEHIQQNAYFLESYSRALGSLGDKLPPHEASSTARTLVDAILSADRKRDLWPFVRGLKGLKNRLPPAEQSNLAFELIDHVTGTAGIHKLHLVRPILDAFNTKISPSKMNKAVSKLLAMLKVTKKPDEIIQLCRALALLHEVISPAQGIVVADKLISLVDRGDLRSNKDLDPLIELSNHDRIPMEQLLKALRTLSFAMQNANHYDFVVTSAVAISKIIPAAKARSLSNQIIDDLTRGNGIGVHEVLSQLSGNLDPHEVREIADRIVALMGKESEPFKLSNLGYSLASLGTHLPADHANAAALRIASVIRQVSEVRDLARLQDLTALGNALAYLQVRHSTSGVSESFSIILQAVRRHSYLSTSLEEDVPLIALGRSLRLDQLDEATTEVIDAIRHSNDARPVAFFESVLVGLAGAMSELQQRQLLGSIVVNGDLRDRLLSHFGLTPEEARGKPVGDGVDTSGIPTSASVRVDYFGREDDLLLDKLRGLVATGKYAEIKAFAERYLLSIGRKFGEGNLRFADALAELAAIYRDLDRYDDAELLMHRALTVYVRAHSLNDSRVARAMNDIGILLQVTRPAAAEFYFRQALAIDFRNFGPEHPIVAFRRTNLGNLLAKTSRFGQAEAHYQRALAIYERTAPASSGVVYVLSNLAQLLATTERAEEAESIMRRVLTMRRENAETQDLELARTLNSLGFLLSREKNDEAIALYRQALAIYEARRGVEHPLVASGLNNIAGRLADARRWGEAEPLLRRALAIEERGFGLESARIAPVLNNLAVLLFETDRASEAEPLLRKTIALLEKVGGETYVSGLVNMAMLLADRGDWASALEYSRRATDYLSAQRRIDIGSPGMKSSLSGDTMAFRIHAQAAFHADRASPTQLEKGYALAQRASHNAAAAALAQMAARGGMNDQALAPTVRDRQDLLRYQQAAYGRLLMNLSEGSGQEVAAARLEIARLSAKLDAIDKKLAKEFPKYSALVNPAPIAIIDLQRQLDANDAVVLFLDGPVEVFAWVVTKNEKRWFLIDLSDETLSERVQALHCGLNAEEWEGIKRPSRCARLLKVRKPKNSDPLPFDLSIAHDLYKALFGQFEELVKDKFLMIVPSGAMTSLPWQALVTEAPETALPKQYDGYRKIAWLARRHAFAILPSVASLRALREFAPGTSRAPQAYLGYGNPVLEGDASCRITSLPASCPTIAGARAGVPIENSGASSRRSRSGRPSVGATLDRIFREGARGNAVASAVRALCPLPDTAHELQCVARNLDVPESQIFLGKDATEASIKEFNTERTLERYRILHFATHGLVAGDVELMAQRRGEPALVLTPPRTPTSEDNDGLLTASEVAQLRLNADWVVLSACNTASGEKAGADALSGLAQAFFYAGARALLVSYWPVYSDAAVQLTTRAFAELDRNPSGGRAGALRQSMLALMEDTTEEDNVHPAIWAPFAIIGEGMR